MTPAIPALERVFTIVAEIGKPLSGGRSVAGERLHIPILGGTVAGPRLSGTILPGGSDWPLIRPDGTSEIEASYTVVADDGTPILVRNGGLRVSAPEVLARMRAGEAVSPDEYYFRSAPRFDAPDGPHAWLRDRLFVASLAPDPAAGRIVIDVYAVA
jgi:hypothetical protein